MRGNALALAQRRAGYLLLDMHDRDAVVLDRTDEAVEVIGDVQPVPFFRYVGYERAEALPGIEHAFFAKNFDGLADGDLGYAKFSFELFDRRNLVAVLPAASFNALPHHRCQLQIQRHAAAVENNGKLIHLSIIE